MAAVLLGVVHDLPHGLHRMTVTQPGVPGIQEEAAVPRQDLVAALAAESDSDASAGDEPHQFIAHYGGEGVKRLVLSPEDPLGHLPELIMTHLQPVHECARLLDG